jgi:L-seryl-tRNA(Ser) seleniumtransferase
MSRTPIRLPSVHSFLDDAEGQTLRERYGHSAVVSAFRRELAALRALLADQPAQLWTRTAVIEAARHRLSAQFDVHLKPVFNLTGTVLHTNLGRAILAESAAKAVSAVLSRPCNLEFDLDGGRRGDRDDHVDGLIGEVTGSEAATVVNNNAAAVFLLLNTLAMRKEVIVSRGELIEIGGAFRMPDIMARAGARLREVGTTNRTHPTDYAEAVNPRTALIMKVHRSNYALEGFTASVPEPQLAELAHHHGILFVEDLGSGTLVDLRAYGLPSERTVQQALANGADLVTFSGDKLLGGPQAGLLVGRKDLINRLKRNPLKRALRVDKMTLAALEATLRLYLSPERLTEQLPTLWLMRRTEADIRAAAERLRIPLQSVLAERAQVRVESCFSQIGSGSLPIDRLPSACLAIYPLARRSGRALSRLAEAFRALPTPVIGRIADGALRFDLRCLEDEAAFLAQLSKLEG